MALFNCLSCNIKQEVSDFVFEKFPNSEVCCQKCNKPMKGKKPMSKQVEAIIKEGKHPEDPRPDLKEDAFIWKELLKRFWSLNKELYYAFHALRIGESKLTLLADDVRFTFSKEYTEEFVNKVRNEYLNPNKDIIIITLKRLANDLNKEKTLEDCPF